MLRTLEQKRAEFAYKVVKEVSKANESVQKEYKSLVKKSPALILTSGLIQTLAYYLAKAHSSPSRFKLDNVKKLIKDGGFIELVRGNEEVNVHSLLYLHIVAWLTHEGFGDLNKLLNSQAHELFQATKEVLALLNWMGKFADSMLKGEEI